MEPISQANPLLFFKNPQRLGKHLQQLGVVKKQWVILAKEFEKKPLNFTLEDDKFQMLDGLSIIEKRKILNQPPWYAKILKIFFSKTYKQRMENLAEGCFELMQSGCTFILDEETIVADQRRKVEEWKKAHRVEKPSSPSEEEDPQTPLVVSLFLGNLHGLLSIENLLAKLELEFMGNKADRTKILGNVFETIGLKTLQDCKNKGILENLSADQYLQQNKKKLKELILKNHGNVIKKV